MVGLLPGVWKTGFFILPWSSVQAIISGHRALSGQRLPVRANSCSADVSSHRGDQDDLHCWLSSSGFCSDPQVQFQDTMRTAEPLPSAEERRAVHLGWEPEP
jgi:hypothetical protein